MSAATTYTLCLRRRGNRNKGRINFVTEQLTGAQQTRFAATGMVVDGRGIITVLGGAGSTLSTDDAAYIANPIAANKPVQRICVASLPVAVMTFTINSATNLDGDGTWRVQKLLQTLNCQDEQSEPYVQASHDVLSMMPFIKGVSSISNLSSASFSYLGGSVIGTANDRLYKAYFVNQLSGLATNSGDGGMNGGKSSFRYEYFITNK